MSIKVGDRLPDATLNEFYDQEAPGCSLGPNSFSVSEQAKGKRIVIFGLPGAFTPTCSAKHVPSYLGSHDKL
jgi:peroxiredoxin